jgi:hypothetical protein
MAANGLGLNMSARDGRASGELVAGGRNSLFPLKTTIPEHVDWPRTQITQLREPPVYPYEAPFEYVAIGGRTRVDLLLDQSLSRCTSDVQSTGTTACRLGMRTIPKMKRISSFPSSARTTSSEAR